VGGGFDSTGSGEGPVASYSECGDEPSFSCATELVNTVTDIKLFHETAFTLHNNGEL
jgi:hypothetical protein